MAPFFIQPATAKSFCICSRAHRRRTLQEAFVEALRIVQGAFSLLLLTPEYLLAARDPHGFRPLCIGRVNGSYAVASETCAFDLIDAEYLRDVEPGEIVRIEGSSLESQMPLPREKSAYCVFEHIYFSRPDSLVFGRTVNASRREMGKYLAREHPVRCRCRCAGARFRGFCRHRLFPGKRNSPGIRPDQKSLCRPNIY